MFRTVLALPGERYQTAEQAAGFFRPLLARVKALPGVVDAAASSNLPPYSGGESKIEIAGETHTEEWRTLFQYVSEKYFPVLRIEFKEGRTFSEADVDGARTVAVVNETFARRYLTGESPIGRRVRLAKLETVAGVVHDAWFEIVGVVADIRAVRNLGLHGPVEPEVWVPYTIAGSNARVLGVRMALGAEGSAVLAMVVRAGLRLVVAGVAVGMAASLILVRVIETQLVGVTAFDPATLAATTVLLTVTAAIACWIPARRAARVDPLVALRYE